MKGICKGVILLLVLVIIMVVTLVTPGQVLASESDKDTLDIGVVESLTGWMSFMGEAYDGIKMAVKDINARGGIDGKWKIKVAAKDIRSETPPVITATREFLADGGNIILGGDLSEHVIAMGQMAGPKGVAVISPGNSSPDGPRSVPNGMAFTFTISDNLMSAAMAQYAIEQGYKTVYLMGSPDDPYFEKIPLYFAEVFEKLGGKVVGKGTFSFDQTEYSVEVGKIKKLNPKPDLIFDSNCCGGLAAFVKRLRSEGVTIPYWGPDSHDDPSFFALGPPAEGVVFCSAGAVSPENQAMTQFAKKYEQVYGKKLEAAYPALGYEVVLMVEQAVLKAGSIDPMAIRNAWAEMKDMQMPVGTGGTVTFAGTDGNPIRDVAICVVKNGKKTFIKWMKPNPEDIPAP
jgi:branched-chain amino acid transport system substrate-binding protein